MSAGPEVGWNAGLTDLRPPQAVYYRLWDMQMAWRDVNPSRGVFDWSVADKRIAQVESWGGKPIMVLGLTPAWAAADPAAGDPRWGLGTASPPADPETSWREYVRALVSRYGSRIGAYEIWNEANLKTFWSGTPQQMAVLVRVATEEIGDTSIALAPSVTTRLASGRDFTVEMAAALTPAAIAQLDAWSIHTYPAGDVGPTPEEACEQRTDDIIRWQESLIGISRLNSALLKPVWDTEVNYGLAGPGARPGRKWPDPDGARLLQCTYQDSRALGIAVTAWYEFTAQSFDLLGVQMTPGTPQINAAWTQLPEASAKINDWIPSLVSGGPDAETVVTQAWKGGRSVRLTGARGTSEFPLYNECYATTSLSIAALAASHSTECVYVVGSGFPPGSLPKPVYRVDGWREHKTGKSVVVNKGGVFVWTYRTPRKIWVKFYEGRYESKSVRLPAK
jgi:hypothetical protein